MKAISISLMLLCVVLCGCLTPAIKTVGRDFDETKVSQIKKGVTTANGIVTLFGVPDAKEIVSANQVMWHYTYLKEVKTIDETFTGEVEQTAGVKKNLDILFQDDTVINFSGSKLPIHTEKPIPPS